MEPADRGSI